MKKQVTILIGEPTIAVVAEQGIDWEGIRQMAAWVKSHRPECLPDGYDPEAAAQRPTLDAPGPRKFEDYVPETRLFPHELDEGTRALTDNELLVELAGRKCYDSFGLKAGRKSNAEYIAHTQGGDVPHASILYHAKMTFFIAGVSRRVSHELIRNYVGADRDEEGSPSQESTRFTHHYGRYIAPPKVIGDGAFTYDPGDMLQDRLTELGRFRDAMQGNYEDYLAFIGREFEKYGAVSKFNQFKGTHEWIGGPTGMDRKRIYEAASSYLSHACETSFIWTTNPMALRKLFKERCDAAADLEFQRFANAWKRICLARWPNLFPGLT